MNTEDIQENEYLPTIEDHIAVSKILAFDLKQIKKEISLYGVSWIKDLGKKTKKNTGLMNASIGILLKFKLLNQKKMQNELGATLEEG